MHASIFKNLALVLSLLIFAATPPMATAQFSRGMTAAQFLEEVDALPADDLVIERTNCAMGKINAVFAKAKATGLLRGELPEATTYCLHVLSATAANQRSADLYVRLALNEQGIIDFLHSSMAQYLAHDEPGRTFAAVLQAASHGETSYTGIAGHDHDLPCALALDAGETWVRMANGAPPVAFDAATAADIARQCYDPAATTIMVAGIKMPASKAGLLVGAWLANQ